MAKINRSMMILAAFLGLSESISYAENAVEESSLPSLNAQFQTTECARPCKKPESEGG